MQCRAPRRIALLALLLILLSATPALAGGGVDAATKNAIVHAYNTTPDVWLTFDDCGSDAQFGSILNTLRRYGVRGHFFLNGDCLPAHRAMIARLAAEGHELENHGYQHKDMTKLSDTQVLYQIDHGPRPTSAIKLLRPPYGAGAFTSRLYKLAASRGYKLAFWSVDSCDWSGVSAATIIARVRSGGTGTRCGATPRAGAGGVVLMHVHGAYTAAALPGVIAALRARGLHLDAVPRHPATRPAPTATAASSPPVSTTEPVSMPARGLWWPGANHFTFRRLPQTRAVPSFHGVRRST